MATNKYNVAIIGGGPAGISAGIYTKYDGNNPIIIEAKELAWIPRLHVDLLDKLEGFPGLLNTVNGTKLVSMFRHSLKEMDVDYVENTSVSDILPTKEGFEVKAGKNIYKVRAVILCTGTTPKTIDCPGAKQFANHVFNFAYETYKPYVGKDVVVLGSRNSGSTAAIYLAKHGCKVTIIEKKSDVQAKVKHTQHFEPLGIKTITNATLKSLKGEATVLKSLTYEQNGKEHTIPAAAVYPYIGIDPVNNFAKKLGLQIDADGYVVTNFYQQSNIPGVFVAGDLCGDLKHIVAAEGQGAKAAYNVNKFFNSKG